MTERVVYFLQSRASGAIKIGSSSNQPRRQREVQGGNHEELVLLGVCAGGMEREKALHAELREHRARSKGEWFLPTEEVAAVVARCLAETYAAQVRAMVLTGGPVAVARTRRERDRLAITEAVRAFTRECAEITGDPEDHLRAHEVLGPLAWWADERQVNLPTGRIQLMREVIVECMVAAGAEWDKRERRIVGVQVGVTPRVRSTKRGNGEGTGESKG